jgi:hypothetical protein
MTIEESIRTGIRTRQLMCIKYIDGEGQLRSDAIEGYTLGFSHSNREILKGFHWARYPGPWYSKGRRTYRVERITTVELTGHRFRLPQDETGAKDSSEFGRITCDYYFPGFTNP